MDMLNSDRKELIDACRFPDLLDVSQALAYQQVAWTYIPFRHDALHALAQAGHIPQIVPGRVFYTPEILERLRRGERYCRNDQRWLTYDEVRQRMPMRRRSTGRNRREHDKR